MGDGVNIAARLEGIAEPGGICLSEDAYRQVRDRLKEADSSTSERKNSRIFYGRCELTQSRPAWAGPIWRAARFSTGKLRSSTPLCRRPALRQSRRDPEQEYFVDGVTESLTTDLSRISGSFVIGRNTAFTYKGRHVGLKQIGRELNVRYVLEGSVQRSRNRFA